MFPCRSNSDSHFLSHLFSVLGIFVCVDEFPSDCADSCIDCGASQISLNSPSQTCLMHFFFSLNLSNSKLLWPFVVQTFPHCFACLRVRFTIPSDGLGPVRQGCCAVEAEGCRITGVCICIQIRTRLIPGASSVLRSPAEVKKPLVREVKHLQLSPSVCFKPPWTLKYLLLGFVLLVARNITNTTWTFYNIF